MDLLDCPSTSVCIEATLLLSNLATVRGVQTTIRDSGGIPLVAALLKSAADRDPSLRLLLEAVQFITNLAIDSTLRKCTRRFLAHSHNHTTEKCAYLLDLIGVYTLLQYAPCSCSVALTRALANVNGILSVPPKTTENPSQYAGPAAASHHVGAPKHGTRHPSAAHIRSHYEQGTPRTN